MRIILKLPGRIWTTTNESSVPSPPSTPRHPPANGAESLISVRRDSTSTFTSTTPSATQATKSRRSTPLSMCLSSVAMAPQSQIDQAVAFKALHHQKGQPLVLANVYDSLTARTAAFLPACKALATTSYGIARAAGMEDISLTLEANLAAARGIAGVARIFEKPLTVDFQDGYGDRLEEGIAALIDLGVVGINLEDYDRETAAFYPPDEAAQRVERALAVAKAAGVEDFVVNARCDVLLKGGELDEVIERGVKYLAAGATTVFVWGGSERGLGRDEVEVLTQTFQGRLNVKLKLVEGGLSIRDLTKLGVARISVGPALQFRVMEAFAKEAEKLYLGK